jgi:hypothetical protein
MLNATRRDGTGRAGRRTSHSPQRLSETLTVSSPATATCRQTDLDLPHLVVTAPYFYGEVGILPMSGSPPAALRAACCASSVWPLFV